MNNEFNASLNNLPKQEKIKINYNYHPIGINGDSISLLGIEDFFGNIWEFIDGFFVKDDGYYISKKPSSHGNILDYVRYEATPVMGTNANEHQEFYFKNIEKIGLFNLPRNRDGSHNGYYTDYFWSHRRGQTNIAVFGSNWDHSTRSGAFCFTWTNLTSSSDRYRGARLVYLP